ncbi:hypothetical protein DFA_09197 [Cavenderia fasciculata]|uniref:Uncharacterized protein n=1 Tax=Cavenderia fasciculata TaxID=261658 RepID=F4Q6Y7_CACFS|nr:uncharacterized protein DFA_09197 [Cavenderia fasciculata]EGG16169.1 hypothetical protein DFA_09197 [Cavenderia fasciculata]|eukprot:XP_004352622.1 hypothetical protein DFA_09197 [Cavenderia fasciculata]
MSSTTSTSTIIDEQQPVAVEQQQDIKKEETTTTTNNNTFKEELNIIGKSDMTPASRKEVKNISLTCVNLVLTVLGVGSMATQGNTVMEVLDQSVETLLIGIAPKMWATLSPQHRQLTMYVAVSSYIVGGKAYMCDALMTVCHKELESMIKSRTMPNKISEIVKRANVIISVFKKQEEAKAKKEKEDARRAGRRY